MILVIPNDGSAVDATRVYVDAQVRDVEWRASRHCIDEPKQEPVLTGFPSKDEGPVESVAESCHRDATRIRRVLQTFDSDLRLVDRLTPTSDSDL